MLFCSVSSRLYLSMTPLRFSKGEGVFVSQKRYDLANRNIIDAIIVHELAHLKHGDHSTRFWKLVEDNMPDYKKYKKEMKEF